MSVAENPVTERLPRHSRQLLAINSAVGAVVLLAGLGFIFAGLPMLWATFWDGFWTNSLGFAKNDFLSAALLIMLELAAIGGLAVGAYHLLQTQKQPGVRAGIFFTAVGIFLICWIGSWLGELMDTQFEDNPALGWTVLLVIMGALLGGLGYLFVMVPGWARFLETTEDQGWFHATSYKGNQGVRVRRGTIMGILAVGVCGVITLVTHRFFGTDRVGGPEWFWIIPSADKTTLVGFSNDWYWVLPYTNKLTSLPLMFKVHLMMPLVLAVLLFWLAWRVVNFPAFADFLIATEAEMNKVSWTNRKRLVQDTIVVLVTVFLFTGFLFVVDVIWIKVLSFPGIQVLMINPKEEQQKQQEKAQW